MVQIVSYELFKKRRLKIIPYPRLVPEEKLAEISRGIQSVYLKDIEIYLHTVKEPRDDKE